MLADLLFLLFGGGILLGAGLIVFARNPMIGMLGMLVAFVNAAGLFILFGAEFLGLLLIMVYLGAIAVMFLFVLMTIDVEFFKEARAGKGGRWLGLLVVGALAAEFIVAANFGLFKTNVTMLPAGEKVQNILEIGNVLFTGYALPFQLAGLVLLTAMVGAIVLTHTARPGVKRQIVGKQVLRTKDEAMVMTKPKVGKGLGKDVAKHWAPKTVSKEGK